jgi:hypothetical protein
MTTVDPLAQLERFTQEEALWESQQGHLDRERDWLDVLALVERAQHDAQRQADLIAELQKIREVREMSLMRQRDEAMRERDVARAELDTAGRRRGFLVMHETDLQHAVVSSLLDSQVSASNALEWCLARQSSGQPGTQGRYFVAEVREARRLDRQQRRDYSADRGDRP